MTTQYRLPRSIQIISGCLLLWTSLFSNLQAAPPPTILVLGDSLSAAYGINEEQGWVALLQQQLRKGDSPYQVVNISISGETSQGGLSRLPHALEQYHPQLLILALGANDGLRGNSLKQLKQNLERIIKLAQQQKSKVLLVGMQLPPNYGAQFSQKFRSLFADVAKQQALPFVPFLLEKIAGDNGFFQADGLHPRAQAQPLLLETVWPELEPLL
ncbi:Arylesterase precursor [hydrothermal vent metagenome]|uniref:Arylesterase n=1 Tax=hydrothermal vent metagenome TaxID=652676 RepID=A0A3B0ZA76_9ZZZZ